jgi:ankyrin repeat protein
VPDDQPAAAPLDGETLAFAQSLFAMARQGEAARLAQYLDAGLSPDLTNDKGDTLLILAAYHCHEETVRTLLAAGADHSRANDRGQTALASAVFRQSTATVQALLDAGADPDAGGPTAVELACFFDLPEMLLLLGRPGGEAAG